MSLLASCQQQKTSTGVASSPPNDIESQPQQNLLSLPTVEQTPSSQQTMGSQPQQTLLSFPTARLMPSPQQTMMGNQPQQNIPSFPNAALTSSPQANMDQPQKNPLPFPGFENLAGQSQPQVLKSDFSPNSQIDTQKPSKLITQKTARVQQSQPNLDQQKQPLSLNLLSEKLFNAQTNIEAANLPTNYNNPLRLSLKEAFARAEARNPQLLAAQRNLKISEAGITIAGAIPNPQIGFEYGFGPLYSKSANPQQLSVNQTLEMGGKRSKRLSLAKSQYQLAVLQYDSTRFDTRGQVRRAYAELAAAQASERSQREQIQLLQRLAYIARKRFEAGAAPEADVLQAQLTLNQTEPQLGDARGRIQQARIQLNALMGDSPMQNIEITDPGMFNVALKNTPTELVPKFNAQLPAAGNLIAEAYAYRLDFKNARQQTEVAQQQLRLNKAQRVPDLDLSGGYQFTTANDPNANSTGFFLGVAVNVPLFYNQEGEIAQARATIDQSIQQEKAVQAQIDVDVRSAYEALLVAREKIRKYQSKLLHDSREVLALAQESYQVGKTDLVSAITFQQTDQQNRSAYVDAVTAYQSAYADLEKAVGIPLSL